MELFGYKISKKIAQKANESKAYKSFVTPGDDDGSINISSASSGYFGQFVDLDGTSSSSDRDLIPKYREAARQPECDSAINDIVDGAIASAEWGSPVKVVLEKLDQPSSIKTKINDEFEEVLKLFRFNAKAEDLFRDWYIDGRLYFHIIVEEKGDGRKGIKELRQIDPTKMRKIKEIDMVLDESSGVSLPVLKDEYYIFTDEGMDQSNGLKIAKEAIIDVSSGILDPSRKRVVSHLYKAIKLVNQLRMLEDALVMYRISRAPERRIFYIDTGNLPKGKAEEYVSGIMNKYRNKLVYDANTGELKDEKRHMSMVEDFWLPRKEGGRGTEITTLPGGENLGQIEDVLFFQKKLFRSLNVPISRLESDSQFSLGRSSEMTRDEVKFQKFIDRLRKRFSLILVQALKTQLLLKGIMDEADWDDVVENISIDFLEDNYFSELKEAEILKERLETIQMVSEYSGKYFSDRWIRTNILRQTEDEMKKIDKEIEDEKENSEDELDDLDL